MTTIEIYKDRNNNYYVQAGDYKVRIADGTRHDGTTIGYFELIKKLTIPVIAGQSEQLNSFCDWYKTTDFNCEGNSPEDCVNEYLKTMHFVSNHVCPNCKSDMLPASVNLCCTDCHTILRNV